MITVNSDFISRINILLDEVALDKDVQWERFNFEEIKKHAIIRSAETFLSIEELDTDKESKILSAIAIIAYLTIENTYLRLERTLPRKQK